MKTDARPLISALLVGTFCLCLTGCDLTGANSTEGEARFRVLLTDAPADSMLEANVTIHRVELVDTTGAHIVISEDTLDFDLLELQDGVAAMVADTTVPFGAYAQVRVVVDEESNVLWADSTESVLKIPSGPQTGIKLIGFQALELDDESDLAEILLDFDVLNSFREAGASGMVIFRPVINLQRLTMNGQDLDIENDAEESDGDTPSRVEPDPVNSGEEHN